MDTDTGAMGACLWWWEWSGVEGGQAGKKETYIIFQTIFKKNLNLITSNVNKLEHDIFFSPSINKIIFFSYQYKKISKQFLVFEKAV